MITRLLQHAKDALSRKFLTRRFGLFLLPWLVVWAVPMLRHMWRSQLIGGSGLGSVLPQMDGDQSELEDGLTFSGVRLVKQYPDNFNAQVMAAEEQSGTLPGTSSYDALIKRYPDQTWLIAERLLQSNLRNGLKMTAPPPSASPPAGAPIGPPGTMPAAGANAVPPPLMPAPPPGVLPPAPVVLPTPTEIPPPQPVPNQPVPLSLSSAIELAQLGRQREPENAFYDWMLIQCLLLEHREPEARSVLTQAAHKKYFDAHRRDSVRTQLGALELVRPLLIEEKMQVLMQRLDLQFDDLSFRKLMWDAAQVKRHGDHAQALQVYGDMMQLLALLRDNRDDIDVYSVSSQEVWRRAVQGTPFDLGRLPRRRPQREYSRLRANQFARYARAHGRDDLAKTALGEAEDTIRHDNRSRANYTMTWGYGQVISEVQQEHILIAWIAAIGMGSLILLLITLRWIVYLPLWVPGLVGEPPRRRDLWLTACVYFLLTAGVVAFVLWPRPPLYNAGTGASIFLDTVFAAIITVYPLLLLLSPVTCAAVTVWHYRSEVFAPRPPDLSVEAGMVPRSLMPLFLTLVSWVLLSMTVAFWIAAPIVYKQPGNSVTIPLPPALIFDQTITTTSVDFGWLVAAASILSVICYVGWLIRWRWLAPRDLRPVAHYALRWHFKSLGDWMIILSFAYLLVSLSSLPTRRQADQSLQRFLEQGRSDATSVVSSDKAPVSK